MIQLDDLFDDNNNENKVITIVGAGGKTSLMFSIGEKLALIDKNILITTTTKIYKPNTNRYNVYIGKLNKIKISERITVAGSKILKENKLKGFSKNEIDKAFVNGKFDYILVEGDGSKKKSIKAPRENEPAVPQSTRILIGIIGMDAYGLEINNKNILGLKEFKIIIGKKEGDLIDEKSIIKLIEDDRGLFKIKKERNILVINKISKKNMEKAYIIKKTVENKCKSFLDKVLLVEEFK